MEESEIIKNAFDNLDPDSEKRVDELMTLYEWLLDDNREPAQTKFTAGMLRNIAKEFEFQFKKEHDKR